MSRSLHLPNSIRWFLLPGAALCAVASAWGQGAAYVVVGSSGSWTAPQLKVGYAAPSTHSIVLRADVSSTGASVPKRRSPGATFMGSVRFDRMAVLADYYVWRQVRVTGGLTVNQAVLTGPDEHTMLRIQQPDVMPYMGLGFGNAASQEQGWNVFGDLGLSVGKSTAPTGPSSAMPTKPADEPLEKARPVGESKTRIAPQLNLGASLKF